MAVRVTRLAHPAAYPSPDQEIREQGLRALRLELDAQQDASLSALLQYEIARLHEQREDLASAARDALATTKKAAGFVEPIESLIDIAIRSRSKANLAKLLERLRKLSKKSEEQVRAALGLAFTHLASEEWSLARDVIESALEETPEEPALWLTLEIAAAHLGDRPLLQKAATGRAAHARSTEMRCLLLERVARLQLEAGEKDSALASLRQSVDELPSWRALHTWEEIAFLSGDYKEAGRAALQTATILRAGLEEPEEAELYKIPPDELNERRAIAAQVRAVAFAIRGEDFEEARGLVEQLCEASRGSPLAHCLLMELCRKQGDVEGVLAAIERLLHVREWTNEEAAALLTIRARTASADGLFEDAQDCTARIRKLVPAALLPEVHDWILAEGADSLSELCGLVLRWAKSTASAAKDQGPAPVSTGLTLSASLLQLISGDPTGALTSLGQISALERRSGYPGRLETQAQDLEADPLEEPRRSLSGRTSTLIPLLMQVAREMGAALTESSPRITPLSELVSPGDDQKALSWNELRRQVEADGPARVSPSLSLLDSWTTLVLSLLAPDVRGSANEADSTLLDVSGANGAPLGDSESGEPSQQPSSMSLPAPPPTVRDAIGQYCAQADPPDLLKRALWAMAAAESGNEEDLARRFREDPADPFFAGAYLTKLVAAGASELSEARAVAAEDLDDRKLASAWFLKSSLEHLRRGDLEATSEALSRVQPEAPEVHRQLSRWLETRRAAGDPKQLLENLSRQGGELLRVLPYAALLHKYEPERLASKKDLPPSLRDQREPTLLLLLALRAAVKTPTALADILDELDILTDIQKAQLALSPLWTSENSEELLAAAREWVRASPTPHALVVLWVAALRARDLPAQAMAMTALGRVLDTEKLLPAVPSQFLSPEEQEAHVQRLIQIRDQSRENWDVDDDTPESVLRRRQATIANWSLLEHQPDAISDDHARATRTFAFALDPNLKDPDSQAAALVSAFEYIALGDYQKAIELLEPLARLLPEDLIVCRGAQLVAHELGRPDLEAPALRELARAEESNAKAADLWERAGLLYEDFLESPSDAEECYSAALARRPGSRISFERLYRFARNRKDRLRQVELLDARIATADTEALLIELYWEKARYCRMLGRRAIALSSLVDLLSLSPGHLPSLALCAELYLVEGQLDEAVGVLAEIARHPDTPKTERVSTGLYACDLFEQLKRSKESVELLQFLDAEGLTGSGGLERRARSLARVQDWGAAYRAFADLSAQQDAIDSRLESARMMLAIQRDYLRDTEELKLSVRSVLRDADTDADAVALLLELNFHSDERRRLLAPARHEMRTSLRQNPLDPQGIAQFAALCEDCGDDALERVSLGILALTGKLSESREERLWDLQVRTQPLPSYPWNRADLELMTDPLLLGSLGKFLHLVAPYFSAELDPPLEAMGVSSLMRMDEFSGSAQRAELGTWLGAFGRTDFELYVGGSDPTVIRGIAGALPTLLVGKDVPFPLGPFDRARTLAQISGLLLEVPTFLHHPTEILEKWLHAAERLAHGYTSSENAEIEEIARTLSKSIPREVRDEMTRLGTELSKAGISISRAAHGVHRSAARVVIASYGDPSVLRQMPELLPQDQATLDSAMTDVIRFSLSDDFFALRQKAGLEGA